MSAPEDRVASTEALVKLIEVDDFVRAERVAEFLEAGGVEVFTRSTHEVGGILGAPGSTYVVEVAQSKEGEARRLLESFEANEIGEPEAASEPGDDSPAPAAPEKAPGVIANLAAYQRASTIILGISAISIAIGVLTGASLPIIVFGSAVFDVLIWRRFGDPELSLASAKKVRFFALSRVVLGAALALAVAVSGGGIFGWLQLAALAYVAFLYFQPLVVAQLAEGSPTSPSDGG
jgi:hypothetical protein